MTLVSLKPLRGGGAVPRAEIEHAGLVMQSTVQRCYPASLSLDDDKGPAGRMVAKFDIVPSGGVENIEITGVLSDQRPAECLRASLRLRRFSPRESAAVVTYRAIFKLEPGDVREVPDIRIR